MTSREVDEGMVRPPLRTLVRRIRRSLGLSAPNPARQLLRREIKRAGGSMEPRPLPPVWTGFANHALLTQADADTAVTVLRGAGLVPHRDIPKSWDALVALGSILDRVPRSGRVLEMGATQYSPLLTWLFQYGYRQLIGIDLVYKDLLRRGPIEYLPMDLTATTFPDASFRAIACLSVIEHGVDVELFLRESARLLEAGGVLVVSTDYWPDPVDTGEREAYGHRVRIFDRPSIEALIERAKTHGLRPVGDIDLSAQDRVVRWQRMELDYTFVVLVFERLGARA
jgi:SAM-dependent methyltransferase